MAHSRRVVLAGFLVAVSMSMGLIGIGGGSTAEAAPLSDPIPASESCVWFGTIDWTRRSYVYNEEYNWSDRQFETRNWSSQPVAGHECGAQWAASFTLDYVDEDLGQDCTRTYTRTDRAESMGTGHTSIGILEGGTAEYPYYLSAYAYPDQQFEVNRKDSHTGCGDNSESTSTYSGSAGIGLGCVDSPGGVMSVESANVQTVVKSCQSSTEHTNDAGTVATHTELFEVSLRRTICDQTVDSDRDGLSDCAEYDYGTDSSNSDTDGDGFIDGSDQCALEPGANNGCDSLDPDQDGDGVPDRQDNCPATANPDQANFDSDAAGDACDTDIDGDGIENDAETAAGTNPVSGDTDGDGIPDGVETNGGTRVDTDNDGIVDGADTDSDGDSKNDAEEGTGDEDNDGIPNWRDPDLEYHVWITPTYNYVGTGGVFAGGDAALVTGFGASLVQEVCFVSTWSATVKGSKSTVPPLWNGQIVENLDETTSVTGDGIKDIEYTIHKSGSSYTQTVVLEYCDTPTSTPVGYYFNYPLTLQIATLSGVITSVSHSSEAFLVTSAGRQGSVSLGESSSTGKFLRASWSKTTVPVLMKISG